MLLLLTKQLGNYQSISRHQQCSPALWSFWRCYNAMPSLILGWVVNQSFQQQLCSSAWKLLAITDSFAATTAANFMGHAPRAFLLKLNSKPLLLLKSERLQQLSSMYFHRFTFFWNGPANHHAPLCQKQVPRRIHNACNHIQRITHLSLVGARLPP